MLFTSTTGVGSRYRSHSYGTVSTQQVMYNFPYALLYMARLTVQTDN